MNLNYINFGLPILKNSTTLNLFSDASSTKMRKDGKLDTCYGAVAVNNDTVIDEWLRLSSDTTVPASELRGIRCSLVLAYAHKNEYKTFNLFSDSQLAILGLREYMYNWGYDPESNSFKTRTGGYVKNQSLYIEIYQLLTELRRSNIVNLYHQKGHIGNSKDDIMDALRSFKKVNNVNGKVDYNVIRYISTYNNYIDRETRSLLRRTDTKNKFGDSVSFDITDNLFKS